MLLLTSSAEDGGVVTKFRCLSEQKGARQQGVKVQGDHMLLLIRMGDFFFFFCQWATAKEPAAFTSVSSAPEQSILSAVRYQVAKNMDSPPLII